MLKALYMYKVTPTPSAAATATARHNLNKRMTTFYQTLEVMMDKFKERMEIILLSHPNPPFKIKEDKSLLQKCLIRMRPILNWFVKVQRELIY